jgi:hypothetical protein
MLAVCSASILIHNQEKKDYHHYKDKRSNESNGSVK